MAVRLARNASSSNERRLRRHGRPEERADGGLERRVQQRLGLADRLRREGGQPAAELQGDLDGRPRRHDPVRQAEAEGVLGRDALAQEDELLGPQEAGEERPRQRGPVAGHQPQGDVGIRQEGLLVHHDDVAETGQAAPEPDRRVR